MTFTDIFIRRPVFATVLSLIVLLIGARAYFDLPLRQYPKIDVSAVTVTVSYPGASAEIMEGLVTTPIESAISGVDGIDYITSSSNMGTSSITIYFNLGYDINAAITDVTDKVSSVRWNLPQDIHDPVIEKSDPNASPTMYLSFSDNRMSGEELTDYLIRVVQPQLQVLPGVGSAQVWSANVYGMRIWLNPYAMAAHDITASDVILGLNLGNVQAPSGLVRTGMQEFKIKTISDISTAEQFNDLILRNVDGQLTRIRDVGRAQLGSSIMDMSVFVDGKPGVVVPITPQVNANPLDVSKYVNDVLAKFKSSLPKSLSFSVIVDTSKFIAASIKEVQKTIVEAAVLVIAIVFLFLGSWRVLLIPAVTIPLSIIGVFGIMLAIGYSINTLTLLALVLAIGMVVDDAIVVAENIYRHISAGKSPIEAALIGAKEIQFAIISITLTLAAVYAPIGFMTGLTGALFKEFAFSLAGAVIISGFVALTLSPMMCSKIMTANVLSGKLSQLAHDFTAKTMAWYRSTLERVLKIKVVVVIFMILVLGCCLMLYKIIPSELAPSEDVGWIYSFISAPSSANIDYTQKYTSRIMPIYESIAEREHYIIVNGTPDVTSAMAPFSLKPWDERKRGVNEVIQELLPKFWAVPGILAYPTNPYRLPGAGSFHPIEVAIQTMGNFDELNDITQKLLLAIKANKRIVNVDTDLKIDQPQLDINIDRNKAGDLGIPVKDIADAINLGFGEPVTTHFDIEGRSYDVIPELEEQYRNKPDLINSLQLRTSTLDLVPLSNLVTIKEAVRPRSLNHFQQMRAATITADLTPGYTLGQALEFIQAAAKKIAPETMKVDYSGQTRQFLQSSGKMTVTLFFAIIFIFLVLAAQFESFRDPFVVMFSVPLSTFGALLALLFTKGSLNIYSEIGLLTLVGLISKHGILIVEFANQLRKGGKDFRSAIVESASIRLRPILMTTAAMILGALPLAFARGAGAVSRQQIGWVVIGGMSIGTIFTLFIVPTMYLIFAKKED